MAGITALVLQAVADYHGCWAGAPRGFPSRGRVTPSKLQLYMLRLSSYRDFDWVLLGFVALLSLISVLEIKSATLHTKFHGFDQKQIVFLAIGLVLMFVISLIDYHRLIDIVPWAYGISIMSLIAVKLVGQKVLGLGAGSTLAGRSFPAVGVGEAGPDRRRCAVLLESGSPRTDLDRHLEGICAGLYPMGWC